MWYMGFYAFNSLRRLYGVFFSCISYYGWTSYLSKLDFSDFTDEGGVRMTWKNCYIEIKKGKRVFQISPKCLDTLRLFFINI